MTPSIGLVIEILVIWFGISIVIALLWGFGIIKTFDRR